MKCPPLPTEIVEVQDAGYKHYMIGYTIFEEKKRNFLTCMLLLYKLEDTLLEENKLKL